MNKVFLNGYIFREPTAKETSSKIQFCTFTIIVSDIRNPKYENYVSCIAWGSLSAKIVESFKKGQMVSIDGRLRTSSYVNNEDGKKVYSTEIVVDNIQLLNNSRPVGQTKILSDDNSFESFDYRKHQNDIPTPVEVTSTFDDGDWDELDYFTEEDDNE